MEDGTTATAAPPPRRPSRALAAWLYGGTALAAMAAPAVRRRLARRLPAPVAEAATLAGLVGGGWATIAVLERVRPFRPEWNRPRGDVTSDLLSATVAGPVSQVVATVASAPLRTRLARTNAGPLLARLPLPARVALTISAFDLLHYWHHRLAHEHDRLWRVHAVHHSAERLYFFNATRFHPLEMIIDGIGETLVLAALGVDADTRLAHQVARGVYGHIQHGNVDLDSGPLNAVLSTPERHRWHHSTDVTEGNTNYGAVVATWDRLFGSSHLPAGRSFDATIGVGGHPGFPQDWPTLLRAPLRWPTPSAAGVPAA